MGTILAPQANNIEPFRTALFMPLCYALEKQYAFADKGFTDTKPMEQGVYTLPLENAI